MISTHLGFAPLVLPFSPSPSVPVIGRWERVTLTFGLDFIDLAEDVSI